MPLKIGSEIPPVEGMTGWINEPSDSLSFADQPVLVHFWAISCPICKMNMPRLQQLTVDYSAQGLHLLSVHMPRMEADMDVNKVEAVMEEMNLTGPCAIDNNHTVGNRFETGGFWPCYFLFDAEGKLRSRAAGALGLKMAENSLKRMLGTAPEEPTLIGAAQ